MVINRRTFLGVVPGLLALSRCRPWKSQIDELDSGSDATFPLDLPNGIPCSLVSTSDTVQTKVIHSDEWIIHEAIWETVGDEGPQALQDLQKATTHEFFIDGLKIEKSSDYWRLSRLNSSQWELRWQYPIAPQSVGKHSFRAEIEFDEPLKTRQEQGLTTLRGFRRYLGGYSVVS